MSSDFYVVGGTLRHEALSYVVRRADRELYESLSEGRFCYLLTPRQMGKSSLMIRIALRLREEGASVAVLDLTAVGQNLDAGQWYGGLLNQIGHQLDIEDELIEFWDQSERLSPLQRWIKGLVDVILPKCPDRLFIFVDEIDTVRNLPFSTDEFFAGIRELYNQRARNPEMNRLAFCLLGVATPSDLIRDTRTTPFNIGHRIELTDFTEEEAEPLREGLARDDATASKLLRRILYWTGGHPYLTQRFCNAAASDSDVQSPGDVDRLCDKLFLSPTARNLDDNLLFVRERLLRSEADRAGLLELYRQVHKGKRVPYDEANPLIDILNLSGIARSVDGRLEVRNRIYRQVFDRKWIQAAMPDAELRRQRAAYRRGLLRATAAAAVILIALSGLSIAAFLARRDALEQGAIARREKLNADLQRNRAEAEMNRAEQALRRVEDESRKKESALAEAESQNQTNRRLLYSGQMNQAQRALESNNTARVLELLEGQGPELRGFEWYYLWRLCHSDLQTTSLPITAEIGVLAPDGRMALLAGEDRSVLLWDTANRRPRSRIAGEDERIASLAISPDKRLIAAGRRDGTLSIMDGTSGREVIQAMLSDPVTSLVFSADGKKLATGTEGGTVIVFDVASGRQSQPFEGHTHSILAMAFSPDGRLLATGAADRALRVWDVATRKELYHREHSDDVTSLAFSPDGRKLATGSQDGSTRLWDVRSGSKIFDKTEHDSAVNAIAFSHQGGLIATGSMDTSVKIWRTSIGQPVLTRKGHTAPVFSIAFSDDDKQLISVARDNHIKAWDATAPSEPFSGEHAGRITSLGFSPDGKWMATTSTDRSVRLWDVASGRETQKLAGEEHKNWVNSAAFSHDGKWLITGSQDQSLKFWNPVTKRLVYTFDLGTPVNSVVVSPDSRRVAVGLDDGSIRLWSIGDRREAARLAGHEDTVTGLDFSPDGRSLVSGCVDGTVRIWDVAARRQVRSLNAHRAAVTSVVFSPDGLHILTGGEDGTAKLWEAGSLAKITLHDEIEKPVTAANFSPDGKRLVIGHNDGSVNLWDVFTRQLVYSFKEHTGRIYATAFSPDGTRFATGSLDQTWKLFRAASAREVSKN